MSLQSYQINFYDRKTSTTVKVDVFQYTFMVEIYHIIKQQLSLPDSVIFTIFSTQQVDGKLTHFFYKDNSRLDEMLELITTKKIRHFVIYYKTNDHGDQVADMSPCTDIKNSVVISGYKRFVNGSGEKVQIGDVDGGAYITIPANSGINGTVSIKTIGVTDDFFTQHGGSSMTNVTRGVGYNTKANSFVNKKK